MSNGSIYIRSSSKSGSFLGLKPPIAWAAILGLILLTAGGMFVGGPPIRFGFPLLSFAVGVLLYRRYPVLYIGFTWWIWMLTPFVARVVDLRSGWDSQRVMLVAPFLVTFISGYTLLRRLPTAGREGGLPYIITLLGLGYGTLIGLVNSSPYSVARALMDWLGPILFSFHLFINWRSYPEHRKNIQQTFLWGVLITGAYGIFQYMTAPAWDNLWLTESGMESSAGKPEPLQIRVWSTMHSPGPFGHFMMVGLLLLFSQQTPLVAPAAGVGYLAFLLSLVRSAWGGWLVGMVSLLSSLKPKLQMRLILSMFVLSICVLPLTMIEPFSQTISDRVGSISNLSSDQSYADRSGNYEANLNKALSNYLGNGIGGTWVGGGGKLSQVIVDSGIIDTFSTLGWLGGLPYLSGLGLMLFRIMRSPHLRADAFISAAYAASLGSLLQLLFSTSTISLPGMLLWSFLGICMAGHNYYQSQRTLTSTIAPSFDPPPDASSDPPNDTAKRHL